jgi:homoserine O-acetyltransferase/O-succinyltransferase
MTRRMLIDAIRNDPDWNGGDYDRNPSHFVYTAPIRALMIGGVH